MAIAEILGVLSKNGVTLWVEQGQLRFSAIRGALTEELRRLVTTERDAIRKFLELKHEKDLCGMSGERFAMSSAQRMIFAAQELSRSTTAFNMPFCFVVEGEVDRAKLDKAILQVVNEHRILRASFSLIDGVPTQWTSPITDLGSIVLGCVESTEKAMQSFVRPFSLSDAPLFRIGIGHLAPATAILCFDFHHIIADAESITLLLSEICDAYSNSVTKQQRPDFFDYSIQESVRLEKAHFAVARTYWMKKLSDYETFASVKPDYNKHSIRSGKGGVVPFRLGNELSERIDCLCKEQRVTAFMFMLACYSVLISKHAACSKVTIVTPSNLRYDEYAAAIGPFVNMLPICGDASSDKPFLQYLREVRENVLEALEHRHFPINELNHSENNRINGAGSSLFDVAFTFENSTQAPLRLGETELKLDGSAYKDAKFDLAAMVTKNGQSYNGLLEYCTGVFKETTVSRMAEQFLSLMHSVAAQMDKPLGALEIAGPREKEELRAFEGTIGDPASCADDSVAGAFEEQVRLRPEAIAIEEGGSNITYSRLNGRANRLAQTLRSEGVNTNSIVAIVGDRSTELIIAMLAVLKAGGAYLPIDPEFPEERILFMLADSGCKTVLHCSGSREISQKFEGTIIRVGDRVYGETISENAKLLLEQDSLAYIIYTSGSTGTPKGVMVRQRSLVWLCQKAQWINIGPEDIFLLHSPITFDVSVYEIWGALLNGARLAVIASSRAGLHELGQAIVGHKVSTLFLTSGLFAIMVEERLEDLRGVRQLLSGGDTLSASHCRLFRKEYPTCSLINCYGPTEGTIFATSFTIAGDSIDTENVAIGRPINGTQVYIVDQDMRKVAIGIPGELCVGGIGVATGYLNSEQLSRERFIENPFNIGSKLYRTGDIARWLPDGNIEFIGRNDSQTKIRGFRVELGEVENALRAVPGVQQAVAILRGQESEKTLIAFYVGDGRLEPGNLKERIQMRLPAYMIPDRLVRLDKLPLTGNGKIDRDALRVVNCEFESVGYEEPKTSDEANVVEVYKEVLRLKKVGRSDGFFLLGGNSLKAMRAVSILSRRFGRTVPLRLIFEHPSVLDLASSLASLSSNVHFQPIEITAERNSYSLSPGQRRIFAQLQFNQGSTRYNVPFMGLIPGRMDLNRVEAAIISIIERHDSFRAYFTIEDGAVIQRVLRSVKFAMERIDGRAETAEVIAQRFVRPFDLAKAPLMRAAAGYTLDGNTLLIVDMHHIVTDGISMAIVLREMVQYYSGKALPALRLQYKDFVVWQETQLKLESSIEECRYWKSMFEMPLPILSLPTDFPRPTIRSIEGQSVRFRIDSERTNKLRTFSKEKGITLYSTLFAIYSVLLSKYSGQNDIVIGTPVAARTHPDLESMVGMFVNTLAIRSSPLPDKTFDSYIEEVSSICLECFSRQSIPFERVLTALELERDLGRNPLFDVMFVLNEHPSEHEWQNTLNIRTIPVALSSSNVDLTWRVSEMPELLDCELEYSKSLFGSETIERMRGHLINLVDLLLIKTTAKLKDISLLDEAERQLVLSDFNDTAISYGPPICIHELFEARVKECPTAIALEMNGEHISFGDLNSKSNSLANCLRDGGTSSGSNVAVLLDRSFNMVAALLAILKAGCAYVPIDPAYPQERIDYILLDAQCTAILTSSRYVSRLIGSVMIVDVDTVEPEGRIVDLNLRVSPNDLSYIIYTSGSTGRPKGAMLEHEGVVNRLLWMASLYDIGKTDVILHKTTYTFDVSVWELFLGPICGIRTVLLELGGERDPGIIKSTIEGSGITTVHFVPSMLGAFLETLDDGSHFSHWRRCICSGEALSGAHRDLFFKKIPMKVQLHNLYGPTEASIDVCAQQVHNGDQVIYIGKPVANTHIYIVDGSMRPVPIGIFGELLIGGVQVGRGYLNLPELTEERFFQSPFVAKERVYRTGDIARWSRDGRVEFKGRRDEQVKIRGYRIELGEIEVAMRRIPELADAVVVVQQSEGYSDLIISAYYIERSPITSEAIRDRLTRELPSYMIPVYFTQIEEIPVGGNGKADRKKLPPPKQGRINSQKQGASTENEVMLAEIWTDILGVKSIGRSDNFFHLGGDSIKAIQVSGRLNGLGWILRHRDLFERPTLEGCAEVLRRVKVQAFQGPIEGYIKLLPIHCWFRQLDLVAPHHWNQSAFFRLDRVICEEDLRNAWVEITEYHDILRARWDQKRNQLNISPAAEFIVSYETYHTDHCIDILSVINEKAMDLQKSLDLNYGPLVKMAHFHVGPESHILVVCHHSIIDAVSWRILQEDFSLILKQMDDGLLPELPAKTNSYRDWVERLEKHAEDPNLRQELGYWAKVCQLETKRLTDGLTESERTVSHRDCVEFRIEMDSKWTDLLFGGAQNIDSRRPEELLLSTLSAVLGKVYVSGKFLVSLEGHGRNEIFPDIDLSRTVGWFTTRYPILLEAKPMESVEKLVSEIRDNLRTIPGNGIGFGILRYLTALSAEEKNAIVIEPTISFNYLGEFRFTEAKTVQRSKYETGANISPLNRASFALDLSVWLDAKRINIAAIASPALSDINWAELYASTLADILGRGEENCEGARPLAFMRRDITTDDLKNILSELGQ